MLHTFHQIGSGFTQTNDRHNGCLELFLEMRKFSSPEVNVDIREWNADWDARAGMIFLMSEEARRNNLPIRIHYYGYSWGCGNGYVKFAKALKKRGLKINHAVLCDPVYRSGFIPSWFPNWLQLAPLSMTSFMGLKIPYKSTNRVDWFYQRQNRPMGVEPRVCGDDPVVVECMGELQADHQHMDDQKAWQHHALQTIRTERHLK